MELLKILAVLCALCCATAVSCPAGCQCRRMFLNRHIIECDLPNTRLSVLLANPDINVNVKDFLCGDPPPCSGNSTIRIEIQRDNRIIIGVNSMEVRAEGPCFAPHRLLCGLRSFVASNITYLQLHGSDLLRHFTKDSLRGWDQLETLRIETSGSGPIPSALLSALPSLYTLELANCELEWTADAFATPLSLKDLVLLNVSVAEISPGAFNGLDALWKLRLIFDKLTNVSAAAFETLQGLGTLELAAANISLVERRHLSSMSKLRYLTIQDSLLELDTDSLSDLKNLEIITIERCKDGSSFVNLVMPELSALLELYLRDCNVSSIPTDFLNGTRNIMYLDLSGNQLSELSPEMFSDTHELRFLDLSKNHIKSLETNVFQHLERLLVLNLEHNHIDVLSESHLSGLKSLDKLNLNGNYLSHLSPDVFSKTPALKRLQLQHNALTELPPVHHLTNLEILNVGFNQIASLSSCHFVSTRNLRDLYLQNNKILEIEDSSFVGLSRLAVLNLNNNRIQKIPDDAFIDLPFLVALMLENNGLSEVPAAVLLSEEHSNTANIRMLYMKHNNLTDLPNKSLKNIYTLDLSYNKIKTVLNRSHVNLFRNVYRVNLSHNNISRIDVDNESNNTSYLTAKHLEDSLNRVESDRSRVNIDITNNPFICDCRLYEYVRKLSGYSYAMSADSTVTAPAVFKMGNSTCASPLELRGRRLLELDPAELTCELPTPSCPSLCSCTLRPHTAELELECPSMPPELPQPPAGYNTLALTLHTAPASIASFPPYLRVLKVSTLGLPHTNKGPPAPTVAELLACKNELQNALYVKF